MKKILLGGIIVCLLTACHADDTTSNALIEDQLLKDWKVSRLDKRNVKNFDATLSIDVAKKNASGTSGCNSFGTETRINLDRKTIAFGNIVATKISCKNNKALFEIDFFNALRRVEQFELTNTTTLKLIQNDGAVIELTQ
jgi:heat shock protein HslJ